MDAARAVLTGLSIAASVRHSAGTLGRDILEMIADY
jgi:hypothetical protein